MVETAEEILVDKTRHYSYPSMTKTLGSFKLTVEEGSFTDSEIIVRLGENGTGKTTFVRLLAGEEPDNPTDKQSMAVSLKPQTISPKFPGTVRMLLLKQIKAAFMHAQFQSDVVKPMNIENFLDQEVKTLSGGELQRVAIILALGKPNVNVYLIDEPSSCVFECPRPNLRELNEIQFLGLGTAHNYSEGHQAFHPTRKKDRFCYRARFHNGDLPR
jgi:ATP-binding cassette subfamily E protein 1